MAIEPFSSPLTEIDEVILNGRKQLVINLWGAAEAIANAAAGRLPSGRRAELQEYIKSLSLKTNPILNIATVLKQSKTDDGAIAMIIQAIHEDLSKQIDNKFDD